jgi:hypothetical protein
MIAAKPRVERARAVVRELTGQQRDPKVADAP